jgi:hypothetical protein
MSLFSKEPQRQSIPVGLTTVLGLVVLVATVNFYRFSRYFPA